MNYPIEAVATFVVGLTGGIASGKTTVSNAFSALGVVVIDTDVIARQVVEPGSEGLAALLDRVGTDILNSDGNLNRGLLRQKIFSDGSLRQAVDAILHPLILAETHKQLAAVRADYVILVVPLLVESGLFEWVDRVLVVDVTEKTQLERLTLRDGNTADQASAMISAQAGRQLRLQKADDVIRNEGDHAALEPQVRRLHGEYTAMVMDRS